MNHYLPRARDIGLPKDQDQNLQLADWCSIMLRWKDYSEVCTAKLVIFKFSGSNHTREPQQWQ